MTILLPLIPDWEIPFPKVRTVLLWNTSSKFCYRGKCFNVYKNSYARWLYNPVFGKKNKLKATLDWSCLNCFQQKKFNCKHQKCSTICYTTSSLSLQWIFTQNLSVGKIGQIHPHTASYLFVLFARGLQLGISNLASYFKTRGFFPSIFPVSQRTCRQREEILVIASSHSQSDLAKLGHHKTKPEWGQCFLHSLWMGIL